jgi:hypothetical protein
METLMDRDEIRDVRAIEVWWDATSTWNNAQGSWVASVTGGDLLSISIRGMTPGEALRKIARMADKGELVFDPAPERAKWNFCNG